jgi:hypothetical protein
MLIKVKFLKDNQPTGREYTYSSPEPVGKGDIVQINDSARGIVTDIDINEKDLSFPIDKIKEIKGKVESEESNGEN